VSPSPKDQRRLVPPGLTTAAYQLAPPPKSPPKPNFNPSGLLAAETNTVTVTNKQDGKETTKGVVLKYNEPPEARKPTKNWRLYVFKGKEQVGEFFCFRRRSRLREKTVWCFFLLSEPPVLVLYPTRLDSPTSTVCVPRRS
jgi:hypothetical protein